MTCSAGISTSSENVIIYYVVFVGRLRVVVDCCMLGILNKTIPVSVCVCFEIQNTLFLFGRAKVSLVLYLRVNFL